MISQSNKCNHPKRAIASAVSTLATLAALGLPPQTAFAQTSAGRVTADAPPAAPSNDIIVTGTRTISNGNNAPTPTTVVSAATIQNAAPVNLGEYVAQQMPSIGGSLDSSHSGAGLISNAGASKVQLNLRTLGNNRTLTLLNGHRFVSPDTTGATDVNNFPAELVSRVDIVTGGASSVYGSDALAGVVNFVLDTKFSGIKGRVSGGVRTHGDNRTFAASIAAGTGFASGRGHFLVNADYAYDPGLFTWKTSPWAQNLVHQFTNPASTPTNGLPSLINVPNSSTVQYAPGGLITSGPLRGIAFSQDGSPFNFNYGPLTSSIFTQGGDYRFTDESQLSLSPANRLARINIYTRASYEITDDIEAYVEYIYGRNHNYSLSKPLDRSMVISLDNPYLPAVVKQRMIDAGVSTVNMGSFNLDLERADSDNVREVNAFYGGLQGKVNLFGSDWLWDVSGQTGNYKTTDNVHTLQVARFPLAVDAVVSNGAIVCRSTLTNPTNGCIPFNPFGWNKNSSAAVNYLTGFAHRDQRVQQTVFEANVRGTAFNNWAGPVAVAFGGAHRSESVSGSVDPVSLATGWVQGNFKPTFGNYKVIEGYGEVEFPLLKDATLAKDLSLNGAIRATNYSTSGYVTTWKLGLSYEPVDGVRFRATRSRDIRAPNLNDLYAQGSALLINTTNNPFGGSGATISQIIQNTTGNTDLKPEISKTWGAGVVLTPNILPGFSASIDYYSIEIAGSIGVVSVQGTVDRCFEGQQAYCSAIFSNLNGTVATTADLQSGRVALVKVRPYNFQYQRQNGVDIEVGYQRPLSIFNPGWAGTFALRGLLTRTFHSTNDDGKTGPIEAVANNSGAGPLRWRANIREELNLEKVQISATQRGVSSGYYDPNWIECTSNCPASTSIRKTIDSNRIPGQWLMDAAVTYRIMSKATDGADLQATVSVDNVFDTQPPVVAKDYFFTPANGSLYDIMGRVFRATVRFRW